MSRRQGGAGDAGRVIAGSARGVRLAAPGEGTRPLGDRVKQTLFAILEPDLRGAAVLDLFAGSGAAGIEALSRGAARAVFVERDGASARVIAENLARVGFGQEHARVVRADVPGWLAGDGRTEGPFDVVVVDPPYADVDVLRVSLERLPPLLAARARVVAKHFWRDRPPERIGLLGSERERRFGESALTFYRLAAPGVADAAGAERLEEGP